MLWGMQLTWLDLLAANMGAMLWLWGVMAARRWCETERAKFVPGFILFVMIGLGAAIFTARAGYWYEVGIIIVPQVVQAGQ